MHVLMFVFFNGFGFLNVLYLRREIYFSIAIISENEHLLSDKSSTLGLLGFSLTKVACRIMISSIDAAYVFPKATTNFRDCRFEVFILRYLIALLSYFFLTRNRNPCQKPKLNSVCIPIALLLQKSAELGKV
jgi:hypothetical protein